MHLCPWLMPFFLHLRSKQQAESLKEHFRGFPAGAVVKNPPANAGDARDACSISGWGRSPGGRNGNPLQYSSLENSIDRGAWWATVYGFAKSRTRQSDWAHTHHIASLWPPLLPPFCTSKDPCGDAGSALMIQAYLPDLKSVGCQPYNRLLPLPSCAPGASFRSKVSRTWQPGLNPWPVDLCLSLSFPICGMGRIISQRFIGRVELILIKHLALPGT